MRILHIENNKRIANKSFESNQLLVVHVYMHNYFAESLILLSEARTPSSDRAWRHTFAVGERIP